MAPTSFMIERNLRGLWSRELRTLIDVLWLLKSLWFVLGSLDFKHRNGRIFLGIRCGRLYNEMVCGVL